MPKRRVSSAKQLAARRANLAKARAIRHRSSTNPIPLSKAQRGIPWPHAKPGSFGSVRRHKLGGKAYTAKTATNFTIHPEAAAILAGKASFRDQTLPEMGHLEGAKPWVPPKHMLKPAKAKSHNKPAKLKPSELHGSGTGLTAAYRYLPANVAKRKSKAKKLR